MSIATIGAELILARFANASRVRHLQQKNGVRRACRALNAVARKRHRLVSQSQQIPTGESPVVPVAQSPWTD